MNFAVGILLTFAVLMLIYAVVRRDKSARKLQQLDRRMHRDSMRRGGE